MPNYRGHITRAQIIRKGAFACLSFAISSFATFDLAYYALTGKILWMHKDGSKELLTFAHDPWRFGTVLIILVYAWLLVTPRFIAASSELHNLIKDYH